MTDRRADVVFVDPPYNVRIDGHVSGNGKVRHREFVQGSGELSREDFIRFLAGSCTLLKNYSKSGDEAPHYLIRDRDRIHGSVVRRRLRAMGIRDKPVAPASPWQNGFAERLIGSIRRECLDHIVVFGQAHLYAGFCDPTHAITMTSERIDP